MGFNFKDFMKGGGLGPVGDIFGGLFGDSGAGYNEAAKHMEEYMRKAMENYQPFLGAGQAAIPEYQDWMKQYKDPGKFLEDTFKNYQMSPGARTSLGEAQRAAGNAASASGLSGSTAHMREAGNIANQISTKDMQQYLNNILGIGGQYGHGLNTLMQGGLGAAGGMGNLYQNMGNQISDWRGSGAASGQNDMNKLFAGAISLLPHLFGG